MRPRRNHKIITFITLVFYLFSVFTIGFPISSMATTEQQTPSEQPIANVSEPVAVNPTSPSNSPAGTTGEAAGATAPQAVTTIPVDLNTPAPEGAGQDKAQEPRSIRTDGTHRKYKLPEGVKGEYVEGRTQFSKIFVKEDGRYVAVISNNSLHYQDDKGKWQDIDNTLKTSKEAGFAYENQANRFQVYFSEKDNKNKFVRFKLGNQWFDFNPLNRNESNVLVNGDTVTYVNLYDGVDFEYIVGSDSLKENIILNSFQGQNSFSFEISETNLRHEILSDETVAFYDKASGKLAWKFSVPYMYDAKGAQSQAVSVKFEELGNKTVLTLTADSNWLSAPERAFPIVIDPDVILNENVSNTYIQRDTAGVLCSTRN